jgi:hypothetical protein
MADPSRAIAEVKIKELAVMGLAVDIDDAGLFIQTGNGPRGLGIQYRSPDGRIERLFAEEARWGAHLLLSPDGAHLAFARKEIEENLWMAEDLLDGAP